ncbi:AAA family ATPase [Candidatus Uhrbacteria bacterium CG_4_9_14_3_um_filter_50_9]|uniref:AAA family ATPase n=1 Tax=Candidatus Uhrbacteria bacterium CG_4_9_14_3_um_filter_50_9 TaxID=1975035 RepID=A0A2M7XAW5_9BACT|nr:MAG: AAA family ATPase [Candidatus Uhrbacteria bacterium CG_4_9_14_3_um_filter_50_9]
MSKIKITKEFKEAYKAMNDTGDHIFLTGRAGTGKSTLLTYFRKQTKKRHVVLAPTGVAALNVKGQTIHSFFGFHPAITTDRVRKAFPDTIPLFKAIETVIIDEISMVRADLLDCVDRALRLNRECDEPFGGVQMIFIGDLYQLPPVVTRDEEFRFQTEYTSPYFFSAYAMKEMDIKIIELHKVHRQKEKGFIQLLEKLRTRSLSEEDLKEWNTRHDPFFDPREETGFIHLTTTNKMTKQRNDYELHQLPGTLHKLSASSDGELPDRRMPSEPVITIKEGARVMFTVNDPERRWVNGTLGTVTRLKKQGLSKLPTIEVELEDGNIVDVRQHKWELFEYERSEKGNLEEAVIGSYTQYPLALAWAVTIHKGQGKTFDHVLVDIGWGTFAHGQLYVALSRCTTFEGLVLLRPFELKDVILDQAVVDFMSKTQD